MLAPAEVPATTAPRSCAATIASPNGVPQTIADSLSWLPPVMKIPVALSERVHQRRGRGRPRGSPAAPAPPRRRRACRNSASYTSTTSAPERGRGRDDRDPGVGATARGDELLEDRAPAELVLGSADDHEWSLGSRRRRPGCVVVSGNCMTGRLAAARVGACSSHGGPCGPPARADASRQGRGLRASPTSSGARRPRRPGRRGGRPWLAELGPAPDGALVSAAARTRETWAARRGGRRLDLSRPSTTRRCTPPGPRPRST